MHKFDELDLLDQAQVEAEQIADEIGFNNDVDRRTFVLTSLIAAAATTFGFGSKALAQAAGGAAGTAPAGRGGGQGGGTPPVPLEKMENISWTFQPYPGGTGALLEKTYREKGVAAFNRQQFVWTPTAGAFYIEPWGTAAFPTTDEEIAFLPAHRLAAAIRAKKLTSTRLTKIYLDRLKKYNPTLLFAVTIIEEPALAYAAQMDAELAAGKYRGPLHGLPWGVKDLFAVKGFPTTWGAQDFENRIIDEDSEVVVRMREAGAVLVAKLSTGQFAQGGGWFRGGTRNPWNTSQSSSGSSAGPGSATAAGCVAFAIGTETSGSIVSPASTCGITALRPTFGRVSRHGGMVLAWSQDRVGPMTRTAQDAAMVFNVIHGADPKDPGSLTMPFRFNRNINLASLRIGVRSPQNTANVDPNFTAFVTQLRALGAKPVDIGAPPSVPGSQGGISVESAAAFDTYVQFKAKELGLDMAQVQERFGQSGRAGGGARGGGAADTTAAGRAAAAGAAADTTGGRGGGRGGRGSADNNGQLNRWVPGRTPTAMDFLNSQRRRLMLITAWQEYLKDIDLYIGGADTGVHAQTGHPVVVVPMAFGVRAAGGGGRGGAGRAGGADPTAAAGAPATPPAPANPQPITTQIAGNLYNDDIILSVAHKYQISTKWHMEKPKLG